jgi:hypothetical protein
MYIKNAYKPSKVGDCQIVIDNEEKGECGTKLALCQKNITFHKNKYISQANCG